MCGLQQAQVLRKGGQPIFRFARGLGLSRERSRERSRLLSPLRFAPTRFRDEREEGKKEREVKCPKCLFVRPFLFFGRGIGDATGEDGHIGNCTATAAC